MRVCYCFVFLFALCFTEVAAQISIPNSSPVTEGFGIGNSASASLPANWKMSASGITVPASWSAAANFTTVSQAASSGSPTAGGRYNWAPQFSTSDRAIGFMTDANYPTSNSIMAFYRNTSGSTIASLNISYNLERYRTNTSNFEMFFYTSTDGVNWTVQNAGLVGSTVFATGNSSYSFLSPTSISRSFTLNNLNIPNNGDIYLQWVFVTGGGGTSANSQGVGLDNVSVSAGVAPIPNPNLPISCPYDFIFVLDESGSITGQGGSGATDISATLRTAAKDLISALNNTGTRVAVVEFGSTASRGNVGGSTAYQVVDNTYITNFNSYMGPDANSTQNANNYDPEDGSAVTNWEAAFNMVTNINTNDGIADLVIFLTDGNPTAYTNAQGGTTSSTTDPVVIAQALAEATVAANNVKAQGSHIFVVAIPNPSVLETNVQQISGPDRYPDIDSNFVTGDYSLSSSETLRDDLQRIAQSVCKVDLNLAKASVQSACSGDTVTFTLVLTNNGLDNDTNIVVTDVIPSGYTYISDNGGNATTLNGNTLTWNIATLGGGGVSTSLQITAVMNPTGNYTNTATAVGTQQDIDSTNNDASFTVNLALNCDDGDPCTIDFCRDGGCVHENTCCLTSAECTDNDPCTIDTCSIGSCLNIPIICNDQNECTNDRCGDFGCEYLPRIDSLLISCPENIVVNSAPDQCQALVNYTPPVGISACQPLCLDAWARGGGGTGTDFGRGVDLDIEGNVYSTGAITGTATFGDTTLVGSGLDIFIVKYDPQGNLKWAEKAGGGSDGTQAGQSGDYADGIATDANGNVYIAGWFDGTINFDALSISSSGAQDLFIAKYDSSGNAVWAIKGGGAGLDRGYSVEIVGGFLYVTGYFESTATISGVTLTSAGNTDVFLAKYQLDGTLVWIEQYGGTDKDGGYDLYVANNKIYVTGIFSGSATFGSFTINSFSGWDYFVMQTDAAGTVEWVRRAGGTGDEQGVGVIADANGNVYATGNAYSPATFEGVPLPIVGGSDIYLAKYNSTGGLVWLRGLGSAGTDVGLDLEFSTTGKILLSALYSGNITVGSTTITNSGGTDILVAKFDENGNFLSARTAGGTGSDQPYRLVSRGGLLYVAGRFSSTANFEGNQLISSGGENALVWKLCETELTTELISGLGSGSQFPEGITTETYVVYNDEGNSDTCSFTVTVVGDSCDDQNPCTIDNCDDGECVNEAIICNDQNACTTDSCVNGICVFTPVVCNDQNPCTNDACVDGRCVFTNIICDDQSLCSTDACVNGQCVFTPITCNDQNACTTDGCNPQTGCTTTPVVCNDGDPCTTDDCNPQTGCTATPIICNDQNACTNDVCLNGQCVFTDIVCDDQNLCTTDTCIQGQCVFTAIICDDQNLCTTDACDDGECIFTDIICNDQSLCTTDACDDGECVFTPIICNDQNACTTDGCNPSTGCISVPVNCDDSNVCTTDTCISGVCFNGDFNTCVATEFSIVSDLNTSVSAGNSFAIDNDINTPGNQVSNFWTATIPSATWIWNDAQNNGFGAPAGTLIFTRSFNWSNDNTAIAKLKIAADNTYSVEVNGTLVGSSNDQDNFTIVSQDEYDISGALVSGVNTIEFTVENSANISISAAGLLYRVDLVSVQCDTIPNRCDDGNACTLDNCDAIAGCIYTTITCNDQNACTADVCNPTSGCVFTPTTCNDQNACTIDACDILTGCTTTPLNCADQNACTTDNCNPSIGCVYTSVVCNDQSACTSDRCDEQIGCVFTTVDCDDENACTADACLPAIGCINSTIICNDGSACTTDACDVQTGCVFTTITCVDGDACTTDGCSPQTGCTFTSVNCNDNNACTTETCDSQIGCVYSTVVCGDNNACTNDICIQQLGCRHIVINCNDGNACTNDGCNTVRGCVYGPVNCNDQNACTTDGCNPSTGCFTTQVNCNDSNPCTQDSCGTQQGCFYFPTDCNDNDPCTVDACDAQTGCTNIPLDCADTDLCTIDKCIDGFCAHIPVVCNDGDACTNDACVLGECQFIAIVCNDDDLCTNDFCLGGTCNFEPVSCDDQNPCTEDFCANDACQHLAIQGCCLNDAECDDNDLCTTNLCNGFRCYFVALCCDDDNPCTYDFCLRGICVADGVFCDDGDLCTQNLCEDGICSYPQINCSDNDACTIDSCVGEGICTHTPVNCNDGNACTTDFCDQSGVCQYVPVICGDLNFCTTDTCIQGQCLNTPITCVDGDLCTDDYCVEGECVFLPVECDDEDVCTFDVCVDGACTHPAISCDDNDFCTIDACGPNGCFYTPVVCNDNDLCTVDRCFNGACQYIPQECSDGNLCTYDICIDGLCSYPPVVCDDENECTTDECVSGNCEYAQIPGCPCGLEITGFTLVYPGFGGDIDSLTDGYIIDLDTLCAFNIRADVCSDTVKSVKFFRNGNFLRTEVRVPFAVEGDNSQGDYHAWQPAPGSYIITAIPYDGDSATGNAGAPVTITITIVDGPDVNTTCVCDDNNPCTIDVVENQVCSHIPFVCDDNDTCTIDECSSGACVYTPIPGCGEPCLLDVTIEKTDMSCGCINPNQLCLLNFAGLPSGTILGEQYAAFGIHISAQANAPGKNFAIIFDSHASGTPDPDLEVDYGNLMVIARDVVDTNPANGLVDKPNDNSTGGTITLLFDYPRTIESFDFIDEEEPGTFAFAYDAFDNLIGFVAVPALGDATIQTVPFAASGVRKLVFSIDGSGAVTNIVFGDCCCDGAATAFASGGTEPYTFEWSNGVIGSGINELCPDEYCVTVTDANGCFAVSCIDIMQGGSGCDDGDSCTTDECVNSACVNTPIPGCGEPCTSQITGYTLVYEHMLGEIGPLVDGQIIDRDELCRFNIRADFCGDQISSVKFILNGNTFRVENDVPYALAGDNPTWDYHVWIPAPGNYTMTAIPYSQDLAQGTAGISLTINFTVVDNTPNENENCVNPPIVDCNGDVNGTAFIDACGFCVWGNTGIPPNSLCPCDEEAQIVVTELPALCQGSELLLKADAPGAASYLWSTGEITMEIVGLPDGIYSVTTTSAFGCEAIDTQTTPPVSSLLSAYVMLAENSITLDKNKVFLGGAGARAATGSITLDDNTQVTTPNTFVRAANIFVNGGSAATSQFNAPVNIPLPAFESNVAVGGAAVAVPANSVLTLNSAIYGGIQIDSNSTVTFTQANIDIDSLVTGKNVTIRFESACVKLRIRNRVVFGENNDFNADTTAEVKIFAEGNALIGGRTKLVADIYTLSNLQTLAGISTDYTTLIGFYLANTITGGEFTAWHWNPTCGCSGSGGPRGDAKMGGVQQLTVVQQEDKVLVRSYPNPFSEKLNVEFSLPIDSKARLDIFSSNGKKIATLFDGQVKAAELRKVEYNPSTTANGLVLYRLQTSKGVYYGKAVMVK